MLILLPPSETKATGGRLPAVDLDALLFPELRPQRDRLIAALGRLAEDPRRARAALGVGAAMDPQILANAAVRAAPTMPAVRRYTGVLYDALDVGGMTRAQRARADTRILVTSALFGVLGAADRIPQYRLSAGSRLPGLRTMAALWRPWLAPRLASLPGPIVDLRSGAYAAFAAVPDAVTVRVVTERPDGSRTVVSHFNKATKGRLARLLATTSAEPQDIGAIARLARLGGLRVERTGEAALQIIT